MFTATLPRILAMVLMAVFAASCGGGGGATEPAAPSVQPAASLWLGNVSTLGATATVSESAPASFFDASVTSQAVGTKFYIAGSYTHNGIASIQGSSSGGSGSFTILYKSPASLDVGTYTDTVTVKGCYDSACTQQIQDSAPAPSLPPMFFSNRLKTVGNSPLRISVLKCMLWRNWTNLT